MLEKIRNAPLMPTEALRALLCMLPMLVASSMGKTQYLVPLGQGGFFFSAIFLPARFAGRAIMGSLVLGLGLGFYLIGGTVAPNVIMALIFTFLVCVNLSFLSAWKIGGPLAFTLVMIYTSGLNTGTPAKASANFMVFAFVLTWSALISLLPIWKPVEPPKVDESLSNEDLSEQGVRMGIGATIALAISYMFTFSKLGWAPSAVANVVRYDPKMSKLRAKARMIGTLGGVALATIALLFFTDITVIVWVAAISAILNGLFKKTKLGMMPLFYTCTILLLYSANNLSGSRQTMLERVAYNVIGVLIGVFVVTYPFPALMRKLNPKTKIA